MPHPPARSPLVLPPADVPARAHRHDGWTPERQATFLRELAGSHCVARAAKAAGMSRQSAYRLRARLKGEPFDLAWTAAFACRFDALAEAAMERALNGVEVPHFHGGELVHTSRKFDERLTIALLMMQDRFGPPRVASHHPAAAYGSADFGALLDRVERGPDTWDEETRAELESFYTEDEEPDESDEVGYDTGEDAGDCSGEDAYETE